MQAAQTRVIISLAVTHGTVISGRTPSGGTAAPPEALLYAAQGAGRRRFCRITAIFFDIA